jgi:hypothetical protein
MRAKANEPIDSLVGARNGKSRVGAGRLHLVATALNVPIAELFDGAAESGGTLKATKFLAFDSQALPHRRGLCQNLRQAGALITGRSGGSDGAEIRLSQLVGCCRIKPALASPSESLAANPCHLMSSLTGAN